MSSLNPTDWPAQRVRKTFLEYFESKQHTIGGVLEIIWINYQNTDLYIF